MYINCQLSEHHNRDQAKEIWSHKCGHATRWTALVQYNYYGLLVSYLSAWICAVSEWLLSAAIIQINNFSGSIDVSGEGFCHRALIIDSFIGRDNKNILWLTSLPNLLLNLNLLLVKKQKSFISSRGIRSTRMYVLHCRHSDQYNHEQIWSINVGTPQREQNCGEVIQGLLVSYLSA